jgi:hypothetical protein
MDMIVLVPTSPPPVSIWLLSMLALHANQIRAQRPSQRVLTSADRTVFCGIIFWRFLRTVPVGSG